MNWVVGVTRVFLLWLAFAVAWQGEVSATVDEYPPVEAELVSEVLSVRPEEPFWVALHLKMGKGWHTYWINPGEGGLATKVEWRLPDGIEAGPLQWPYPVKFETAGIVNYGYEGEILLLSEMKAPASLKDGDSFKIGARAEWLACKKICIPGNAELKIKFVVRDLNSGRRNRWAETFDKIRTELPSDFPGWKVGANAEGRKIRVLLEPSVRSAARLKEVYFFAEDKAVIDYSAAQKFLKKGNVYYLSLVKAEAAAKKAPSRLRGVLVSQTGWEKGRPEKALKVDVPIQ